jgi:N-acetylmuramoyl-L-alanine amidase
MPIVYLSPSNQMHNIGAIEGYIEGSEMRPITDEVLLILQYNHFEVYTSHKDWKMAQTIDDSNNKRADIHVVVHSNAGGGRGCTIFYYDKSVKGNKLSTFLFNRIAPVTPTGDRGLKPDKELDELEKTKAIASYIEVDFHDSVDGATFLRENKHDIAVAIARGIGDYFNIQISLPPVKDAKIYRVQVGAFTNLANAEKLKNELISKGYSAIIKE